MQIKNSRFIKDKKRKNVLDFAKLIFKEPPIKVYCFPLPATL